MSNYSISTILGQRCILWVYVLYKVDCNNSKVLLIYITVVKKNIALTNVKNDVVGLIAVIEGRKAAKLRKKWLLVKIKYNHRCNQVFLNNAYINEGKKLIQAELENKEYTFKNYGYIKDLENDVYTKDSISKQSYNLCSIVSYKYIIRAITLYKSLRKWSGFRFHIWFCTIDDTAYNLLKRLELTNTTIIKSSEVTEGLLKDIRIGRNNKEYCWTLKSIVIEYVLNNYNIKSILYCDTDIFFFAHVKHIFKEWGEESFFVCTKRGNKKLEFNCGYYQSGLLGFKNDYYGKKILTWWKEKCINWCYDTNDYETERWGDQKYLDRIPLFFDSIKISNNFGINAAPWNLILNNKCHNISSNNFNLYINNSILCAYHFGSINIYDMESFDLWTHSPINIEKEIIDNIYNPYIKSLNRTIKSLLSLGIDITSLYDGGDIIYAKNYYKLGGFL